MTNQSKGDAVADLHALLIAVGEAALTCAIFGQALCEHLHRDQRQSGFEGIAVVIGASPDQKRIAAGSG